MRLRLLEDIALEPELKINPLWDLATLQLSEEELTTQKVNRNPPDLRLMGIKVLQAASTIMDMADQMLKL